MSASNELHIMKTNTNTKNKTQPADQRRRTYTQHNTDKVVDNRAIVSDKLTNGHTLTVSEVYSIVR